MRPDILRPTGTAGPELLVLELSESPAWPPAPPVFRTRRDDPPRAQYRAPAPVTPGPVRKLDPRPGLFTETEPDRGLPGSHGEHLLQCAYGTDQRASRFYGDQVLDHLNERMIAFIGRMEMAFVATSDATGECDASLRAGPAGFLRVLDDRLVAYPEYRGNGVLASLGNISENPNVGILMVDFVTDLIGLHVNGHACIVEDADLRVEYPELLTDIDLGRTPERWVVVSVVEAYVHCRKHIPRMVPVTGTRAWGTDDVKRKGGDYFEAKGTPRPWNQQPLAAATHHVPPVG